MRQVPHYAIIGNGRMARHMRHYFDYLKLNYTHWYRQLTPAQLSLCLEKATHVLILISDSAIDDFIEKHLINTEKILIHFSGSLLSKYAFTAHPLQTFSFKLFNRKAYSRIPFVIEKEGISYKDLLPGLPNSHYLIPRADKPYYHALCVMANNFSTLLWQKFFNEVISRYQFRVQDIHPFLERSYINLKQNFQTALTGPLVRNDLKTLLADLEALETDAYFPIFKNFLDIFYEEKQNERK